MDNRTCEARTLIERALELLIEAQQFCPQCNGRKKFEVAGREIWCPICNGTGSTVNGDSASGVEK